MEAVVRGAHQQVADGATVTIGVAAALRGGLMDRLSVAPDSRRQHKVPLQCDAVPPPRLAPTEEPDRGEPPILVVLPQCQLAFKAAARVSPLRPLNSQEVPRVCELQDLPPRWIVLPYDHIAVPLIRDIEHRGQRNLQLVEAHPHRIQHRSQRARAVVARRYRGQVFQHSAAGIRARTADGHAHAPAEPVEPLLGPMNCRHRRADFLSLQTSWCDRELLACYVR